MTNVERIIKTARSQSLSNNELREQTKIYDNLKNICYCTWFFAAGQQRWGDCTARDIFEMTSLNYNFNVERVY